MRDLLKVFEKGCEPCIGRALVCGSNLYDSGKEDRRLRYENAVGVDMIESSTVDVICDLSVRKQVDALGEFTHIDCISVLEHARKFWRVAENLQRCLIEGGTILISVPFVWRRHAYPNDYWRFTADGIRDLFDKIEFSSVVYAHTTLDGKGKIPTHSPEDGGIPFICRTEVFAFGVRK